MVNRSFKEYDWKQRTLQHINILTIIVFETFNGSKKTIRRYWKWMVKILYIRIARKPLNKDPSAIFLPFLRMPSAIHSASSPNLCVVVDYLKGGERIANKNGEHQTYVLQPTLLANALTNDRFRFYVFRLDRWGCVFELKCFVKKLTHFLKKFALPWFRIPWRCGIS